MTRGLIEKADGPDEVAGVLAHEMGHGIEMHPETALVRVLGLSAAADLMLGGSGGTLANIGLVLAQLSYTRAAEREADAHALAILKRAGVSAQGLAQFFTRVTKLEENKSELAEIGILRSHPLTEERRAVVESQPPYPSTPSLSARDWAALRSICSEPKPTDI
jgi:predicted Zn-dependent protease